jgi:hypothetical protein
MASYKNILKHVQKWEGGLVYFPEENQWTNRGVQWTTFQKLAPKLLGIENPQIDDLKNMTQSKHIGAVAIVVLSGYKKN